MPVAVDNNTPTDSVSSIKANLASVTLDGTEAKPFDIRSYAHFDSTPSIGTEFRAHSREGKPILSIRDILGKEDRLRALGRLVSERGVVFFRDTEITPEEQKTLVNDLGRLGGKPATSGLHTHPLTRPGSELGDEITVISNEYQRNGKKTILDETILTRVFGQRLWHSDITFEPYPSDYASLQIRESPETGGDTLWASAYEAYDRLSPAYKTFLEGLTATHSGQLFIEIAAREGYTFPEPRGSPHNIGQELTAVHPVIRTNPVTGWKGLFVNKEFTKKINELTQHESDRVLEFLTEHVSANHDIQVRFTWQQEQGNSFAIWDNRSTFHAATRDLDEKKRVGTRSVSIGERPYFDPKSISRREALAQAKASETASASS
ncbi:hypothetical protein IAT38_003273 [Cryptococcus sp. DSM 104549]